MAVRRAPAEAALAGGSGLRVDIGGKAFGARHILADIAFAAGPGEVLALLAPSGTGKTTALRIVLGLDRAFAGRIDRPPGRAGTVFQEPRLLPWLDVAANLRLVAPDLDAADIATCLDRAGVPGVAALMPRALSLGMARRVALARALAVRPSLLVLDEPFASLEPALAARLAREVTEEACALGAVTLLATHDLDQALAVADRVLVLGGGPPATLLTDLPASDASGSMLRERFAFLGKPPSSCE